MASKALRVVMLCLMLGMALSQAVEQSNQAQAAENAWDSFVKTYGKTYANETEKEQRKAQFFANYQNIVDHKRMYSTGQVTYTTGVNMFSDLSNEEFAKKYTGLRMPTRVAAVQQAAVPFLNASIPANFDWRSYGYVVTPVKNQGSCGSCWAFATIATLESAYNKKKGAMLGRFSEQHLIDCDTAINTGCNGGWPTYAFNYLQTKGAASESSYPYTAVKGTCKSTLASTLYKSFQRVPLTNLDDATFRSLLYTYGPLTVTIDSNVLRYYTGGVINSYCSSVNHAVTVVGYATTGAGAPYYIVKNSWGSAWGEGGYVRISSLWHCYTRTYVWYAYY